MLDHTPRLSRKVIDGTAKDVLDSMPAYLDSYFKSGLKSLSDKIPFRYLDYRIMTPKEEYDKMILRGTGTVQYDLSTSNVRAVEYRFEYDGVIITRPMYLPYASRGNIIIMGGTKYHVVPVLSDTIISPSDNGIFIRLLKAKLNFTARSKYFIVNGKRVPGNIIHGDILKPNQKQITDNLGRPLTATSLYLLGKYGIKEALRRYGNAEDVIVTTDPEVLPDGYRVYESIRMKPRGHKMVPYVPHNVRVLVYGENLDTLFIDNFMFGVIYTLDMLPTIEDDLVNLVRTNNVSVEIMLWRISLGRIIYKNSFSVDRISQDVENHFEALEGYVDDVISTKLKEANIQANDFFELVALLIRNYNKWTATSKEYNADIENRHIDILYYLTNDIIIGFNRVILSLNKRITKTNTISHREAHKILSNELRSRRVYSLTKSTSPNLAVAPIDYSGDILYPKITSILEDQSRGNGVKQASKSVMPESAKYLRAGDLGFGSLLFLGKNLPSPRFKMNMYMDYDVNTGKVRYPDDIRKALKALNELLQGMLPDDTIAEAEFVNTDIDINDL